VIARGVVAAVVAIGASGEARGHEPYSGWTQPGADTSCCNDQDCRPVRSYRGDDGGAYVFLSGRWQPVPPDRVLLLPSPDGYSHVCADPLTDRIYCYVEGSPMR
jgi:hypothetical protein